MWLLTGALPGSQIRQADPVMRWLQAGALPLVWSCSFIERRAKVRKRNVLEVEAKEETWHAPLPSMSQREGQSPWVRAGIHAAHLVGGLSSGVFCDPEETLWGMSVIKSHCRPHYRHSHKLLEASESFSRLISSLRFLLKSPPQRKQEYLRKILLLSDVRMTSQKTLSLLRAAGIKYNSLGA